MTDKKILPIINVEEITGGGFRAIDSARYPDAEKITASRRRFGEVTSFLGRLDRISREDMRKYFINHYYIRAASLNDAYLAMIAICNKLRVISPFAIGSHIIEEKHAGNGIAPPSVFPAGSNAAASAFWNTSDYDADDEAWPDDDYDDFDDDDDYDEDDYQYDNALSGGPPVAAAVDVASCSNPRMLVCNSAYDRNVEIADICKRSGLVFILECDDVHVEAPVGFMPAQTPHSYAAAVKKTDFRCFEIGASMSGCEKEIAEAIMTQSGFTYDNSGGVIDRAAASLDEYTFTSMIRYAINEQLLSGCTDKVITSNVLDNVVKRFCGGAFDKRFTSGKLVGLKRELQEFESIICGLKMRKLRAEKGIGTSSGSCNIMLTGSPGTAKTTLARRFAARLADMGYINGADSFKECRKSDIVGEYVGWTAKKIDSLFSEFALTGGVVFFDEIYTLSEKESTSFDKEAVTAITQNMENYRDKVFCVFGGYRAKMEEFLSTNPGLRSRISYTISFDDYDVKSLSDIFGSICSDAGFKLPKGSREITDRFFERMKELRGEQFGNGREARNLLDNCEREMALRLSSMKSEASARTLSRFTISDIKKAADSILSVEEKRKGAPKNRIGF